MQNNRRLVVHLFAGLGLPFRPVLAGLPSEPRSAIEIFEARTDGLRHTLVIHTLSPQEELRLIAVYQQGRWKPGLIASESGELEVAIAKRKLGSVLRHADGAAITSARWELVFEEKGLPPELYVIACRISGVHGQRSLSRELPDLRRILDMVNEPTPSQREKTIDDILRALFEFAWEPLAFTRLDRGAMRR